MRIFKIVPYITALKLKEAEFNWYCNHYYHNYFEETSDKLIAWGDEYYRVNTMEVTGDNKFIFSNKLNKWRVAAPYTWQAILWSMFHPFKIKNVWF